MNIVVTVRGSLFVPMIADSMPVIRVAHPYALDFAAPKVFFSIEVQTPVLFYTFFKYGADPDCIDIVVEDEEDV